MGRSAPRPHRALREPPRRRGPAITWEERGACPGAGGAGRGTRSFCAQAERGRGAWGLGGGVERWVKGDGGEGERDARAWRRRAVAMAAVRGGVASPEPAPGRGLPAGPAVRSLPVRGGPGPGRARQYGLGGRDVPLTARGLAAGRGAAFRPAENKGKALCACGGWWVCSACLQGSHLAQNAELVCFHLSCGSRLEKENALLSWIGAQEEAGYGLCYGVSSLLRSRSGELPVPWAKAVLGDGGWPYRASSAGGERCVRHACPMSSLVSCAGTEVHTSLRM